MGYMFWLHAILGHGILVSASICILESYLYIQRVRYPYYMQQTYCAVVKLRNCTCDHK